jgi:protein TonB
MRLRSVRETGDYVLGAVMAVLLVGTVYAGVMMLNRADQPRELPEVEGAIRLTRVERDTSAEPPKREKIEEPKPPERLPKTVSSRPRSKPAKPRVDLSAPSFNADMHPGLQDGVALPEMPLGGGGFNLSEVDEAPAVLSSMPPQYPFGAKRRHVEGEVVVRMLVNGRGDPVQLSIHKSVPPGVFNKAALSAAKRWKFRPGRYKGEAVDTWVLLPFKFELTQ